MRIRHWIVPFLFLVFCGLCVSRFTYGADYETNMSTNVTTAPTLTVIPYADPGDIIGSVLINNRVGGLTSLKVYDSSGIASGLIGTINVSTGALASGGALTSNEYVYNLRVSSSITVSVSSTSANPDITILWKNVR